MKWLDGPACPARPNPICSSNSFEAETNLKAKFVLVQLALFSHETNLCEICSVFMGKKKIKSTKICMDDIFLCSITPSSLGY